jgi:hypothetical protein
MYNPHGGSLDDLAEVFLAITERLLGPLALGNVLHYPLKNQLAAP